MLISKWGHSMETLHALLYEILKTALVLGAVSILLRSLHTVHKAKHIPVSEVEYQFARTTFMELVCVSYLQDVFNLYPSLVSSAMSAEVTVLCIALHLFAHVLCAITVLLIYDGKRFRLNCFLRDDYFLKLL